jgi:uncharacterized protein (TIGR00645 family)
MQDTISKGTRGIQAFIERIILYSRFILVVFYIGLAVALAIFAVSFIAKLYQIGLTSLGMSETDILLAMLVLIDKALTAGLIVMVMLSSYENFVGSFQSTLKEDSPAWLGRLDPGSLKIKVAASIIAISSVHLLQVFMNMRAYNDSEILWKTIIHTVFLVSALALGVLDRISFVSPKAPKAEA